LDTEENRGFDEFCRWFDFQHHSMLVDLCDEPLNTILVIDEAHNYLAQKNPFLQKIVREGRSKGVVVFFASQSPNDYSQKFFDFKELLEFSFIFQCEGGSATVQELLGCSAKTARELQVELARLRPFQVVSKSLADDADFTRFRADAFFKAYQ
jgi:DNA sulfur modification protein DndE